MPAGKLFQMRGPATANDLAHSAVLVLVAFSHTARMYSSCQLLNNVSDTL